MSDAEGRFRDYVADRWPREIPQFARTDCGSLLRYIARPPLDEGFVLYASLDDEEASSAIEAQVACFRSLGQDFEWKVHALDRPSDLQRRLHAAGFGAAEVETFMMYGIEASHRRRRRAACEIVRIVDDAGVADVLEVQRQVWGQGFDWLGAHLESRLEAAPGTLSIYCAYLDGRPVGSGWTDFPTGSRFADLHGGSVLGEARGRGIYSALFDVRIDEAKRRGLEHLCVDASSMSRPILERIGFTAICDTVPMWMRFG